VALSFLYLAFLRTLQILRLQRSDDSDLAIEVVVLLSVPRISSGADGLGVSNLIATATNQPTNQRRAVDKTRRKGMSHSPKLPAKPLPASTGTLPPLLPPEPRRRRSQWPTRLSRVGSYRY
jgi:hypothetical protein